MRRDSQGYLTSLKQYIAKKQVPLVTIKKYISMGKINRGNNEGYVYVTGCRQLPQLILQQLIFPQFRLVRSIKILHQRMKTQMVDGRRGRLTTLGSNTNHPQSCFVDFFGKLIDGNVGRCTDQDLSLVLLGEMVDEGCGCDGLAGARGT